ncbi:MULTISPECIES: DUF2076 domain-containing protein [Pantoea]|uniref:ABC transporter substrate-binding protein n=2 Tax=Pantoea stewartii TaxID=66269 RepID=H3R895_PANSE|nr:MULTISPECIES: DUF2076 domain-containing protein [Pantoea]KKW52236.1 ABC transporter substrate-binding protein [Pantoea ananatis]ARF48884.1 ABC transporter substrate-binding protein [Pantoea stewartii subsp. stewartii DC283]EHU02231.1 hypothetical protein CKS_5054 [Pantoea stewartii subsp. stewartii DC283]KAB0551651.1 DUF2076 domain-containing protein [Pantoea stewartii subsp. stewartii]KGD84431.1 hypothetical protein HA47_06385 [Pantoea stewartii subsp. indologenes]
MQREEQQLIENLFSRLKQAESQTAARDAAAEQLIKQHLQEQPGAPYYMAQAILIQEAALKKLNERIKELENQLAQQQAQQQPKSSGGFLSSLFGGGSAQPQPAQPQWNSAPQQAPQPQQPYASAPAPRGSGFLGGALQTAVGVAGGVVMADMLTSMFHHSQPQEIVNIINEQPLPQVDDSLNTFNGGNDQSFLDQNGADNQSFLDQSNGWSDSYADNGDLNDFGGNDFDDDDNFV